ncbi:helix-turn-helix domain-containing protein [Mitsuokella sp.]|uniref:helix-turn-helix domain-containing protein n=1 Tax=Mitsuokella sp. TaxID=2049034 RepID=UPI003D7E4AA5
MNYLIHNISINLKHIRKAKGMSLDVVAEQTGVSKSMLASIERGTANPSIGVIDKILSGLRIKLADLTQVPTKDAYLVDVDKIAPTKDVPGEYRVWTCFPIADNHVVEIYRIDVEAGGTYWSGGHGERTKEYVFVLQGTLSLELADGGTFTIKTGEAFRFASEDDHVYRNHGREKVSFASFFVVS